MALRRTGLVASVLTVALVAGCDPAQATDGADAPDFAAASGVSANCDVGFTATYGVLGEHNVAGDAKNEWFVLLGCEKGPYTVGDQVEVFDGGPSDQSHPHRLGSRPLLHQALSIQVHCVEFHDKTVYIADETKKGPPWHVARYVTWGSKGMQIVTPSNMTVPCVK